MDGHDLLILEENTYLLRFSSLIFSFYILCGPFERVDELEDPGELTGGVRGSSIGRL